MSNYIEWLERKIEQCLEDKDLQREHWAFCQAYKRLLEEEELPKEISDEEIEKAAEMFWGGDGGDETNKRVWKLGTKWYREQLKQRQNGNK